MIVNGSNGWSGFVNFNRLIRISSFCFPSEIIDSSHLTTFLAGGGGFLVQAVVIALELIVFLFVNCDVVLRCVDASMCIVVVVMLSIFGCRQIRLGVVVLCLCLMVNSLRFCAGTSGTVPAVPAKLLVHMPEEFQLFSPRPQENGFSEPIQLRLSSEGLLAAI